MCAGCRGWGRLIGPGLCWLEDGPWGPLGGGGGGRCSAGSSCDIEAGRGAKLGGKGGTGGGVGLGWGCGERVVDCACWREMTGGSLAKTSVRMAKRSCKFDFYVSC